MQYIQLVLVRQTEVRRRGGRIVGKNADASRNLRHVVLDQQLCSTVCPVVKSFGCNIAKVAYEPAPYEVDKIDDVAFFFDCVEVREALVYEAVVVEFA